MEEAKECYSMNEAEAWFEALLTNSKYDYRSPGGRLHIMDGCFDDLVKPQLTRLGTSAEDIAKIREKFRPR